MRQQDVSASGCATTSLEQLASGAIVTGHRLWHQWQCRHTDAREPEALILSEHSEHNKERAFALLQVPWNLQKPDASISLKLLVFAHVWSALFCSLKERLLNSWVIWNGGTHVHRHRSRLLPKLHCRLFWGGLSSVLCLCPYLHACLVAPSLSRQAINFLHPNPQSRQLNAKFHPLL